MRFVTFLANGGYRPGVVLPDGDILDVVVGSEEARRSGVALPRDVPSDLIDIIAGGEAALDACRLLLDEADRIPGARRSSGDVKITAPIPRPRKNVFCVGSNYRAHVSEANRAQALKDVAPEYPVFFTKPPTAVIGPGETVDFNPDISTKMDYEVELGLVIGQAGRDLSEEDSVGHIFGFTIINDVTARDLQRRHKQFLKGKGLDKTCPMGPEIVTIDELSNFQNLSISTTVNGEIRQDGNTRDMIFPIPRLLASLSEGLTLEPGDVLATGTPSGVGYAMDPPNFLKDGDTVTCEIEGIGVLSNVMRDLTKGEDADLRETSASM